ncbi:hypothetical protein AVEN_107699-1 [Araneus ventricosus]|uniref:STPR domain-containing protein n=1 Tax=Araneus ventricosus TaxID=182803 RepID=A0A4Y2S1D8_ARAVE|nr:hypothetical protein AVEN_107699-1 [Araneus ventricosus]
MPKRKRGVTGDAARRQQAIRKRERRVAETDEEKNRRLSTMAQRVQYRRAEGTEQNNSRLSVTAQRGRKRRAEETEEQNNSRLSVMAQHGQERTAEETEEQRNSRLSDIVWFCIKSSINVVDGGFLLHRVQWNVGCKFSSICDQYVSYLIKRYGEKCIVIFDGYGDANNTKLAEQRRRSITKMSVDINFEETVTVTVQQEHFLANGRNRTRLIQLLRQKMTSKGIETRVAKGDADTYIVRCGLEKAISHPTVAIIGEDVDLIMILISLKPAESDIYFMKPGKGKVEAKIFSTRKLQKELSFAQTILLLHAFSGCDTASAIYRKSKASTVNLYKNQLSQMKNNADIFYNPSSTSDAISQADEKMFLAIYKVPANEHNLNNHRYAAFLKSSTKLPPGQWGWAREDDGFPVTTNDPVAPDTILNSIFCRCTTGCGGRCGCRKAGMQCSSVCGTCHGISTNGAPLEGEEFELDREVEKSNEI